MFGSNKEKGSSKRSTSNAGNTLSHNSLVAGTVVKGDVSSESDIRIDGEIYGTLICRAKVVIGPKGLVEGKIVCKSARIEGHLKGDIRAEDLLDLRKTARITGDIISTKLVIEDGAIFNGSCKMQGGKASSNTSSNNAKPIRKEQKAS